MEALATLVAVILGLFLSLIVEYVKSRIKLVQLGNAISQEIELNLQLIDGKKSRISGNIRRLKQGSTGMLTIIPFSTGAYDRSIAAIGDVFDDDRLLALHFIREYYRAIDLLISNFHLRFEAEMINGGSANVLNYINHSNDILMDIESLGGMLRRYLSKDYRFASSPEWIMDHV